MSDAIELLVVDLDGTLLDPDHKMTEKTEKALKAVIEKGIKVVIATGKTRVSANDIIKRLDLKTPGIYTQGLTIHQSDGTVSYQKTLDPALARQVITFAEERGYIMAAYSGSRILVRNPDPRSHELTTQYGEPEPEAIGALQNVLDDMPINKLIAIRPHDPRKIKALRWQLERQLDGKARLVQAMVPDMVEILPPGASKGTALKVLLREMGISADNMMAIGDGENDIEMIKMAKIGVAMGNADKLLKEVADHVVGSNADDGVAEAIEKFIPGISLTEEEKDAEKADDKTKSTDAKTETKPEETKAEKPKSEESTKDAPKEGESS